MDPITWIAANIPGAAPYIGYAMMAVILARVLDSFVLRLPGTTTPGWYKIVYLVVHSVASWKLPPTSAEPVAISATAPKVITAAGSSAAVAAQATTPVAEIKAAAAAKT